MHFKYSFQDSIELRNHTVTIHEQIKATSDKEVYEVIGDFAKKERFILKVIYNNDQEARVTINFYLNDNKQFFVEIVDFFQKNGTTYLLLKYYKEGTIYEKLKNSTLTKETKLKWIEEILKIGCHLHENNYIHGDIKPDNFFIDDNKIKLGDLESTTKLSNIYSDKINKLMGTKGFKYSAKNSYDLYDELFAYLATIYYILTGSLLLSKDEIEEIYQDDPFNNINAITYEKIENNIKDTKIANFLIDILNNMEQGEDFNCCDILKNFKDIQIIQNELETDEVNGELKEEDGNKNKKTSEGENKKHSKLFKLLYAIVLLFLLFTLTLFFNTKFNILDFLNTPNTPKCKEAYFIEPNIVKTIEENGRVKYYNYQKNSKKFNLIKGEEERELIINDPSGESIECKDGRVYIK